MRGRPIERAGEAGSLSILARICRYINNALIPRRSERENGVERVHIDPADGAALADAPARPSERVTPRRRQRLPSMVDTRPDIFITREELVGGDRTKL